MFHFEQMPLVLFRYGSIHILLNRFPRTRSRREWHSGTSGFPMSLGSRSRVRQDDLPLVVNGPASRRLPLRILFVHSGAADVEHCVHELRRAHFKITANVVLTLEQLARQPKSNYYDVVLAQYPGANWLPSQLLAILHRGDRQIPCILLTGTMQPETVAELITQGAADCVAMDHVGHLPVAIRRALSDNHLREERDRTEKKLRHSEARYRALVGNLTYGMCRCSSKGTFLNVNQALVTMFGYNSEEDLLAANHAAEVLCDPAKRAQLLGRSTGLVGKDSLEIEWKRKDGTVLKVRLSGREVSNEGEERSYEIIVEDVTQQRKLEDHLRQQ